MEGGNIELFLAGCLSPASGRFESEWDSSGASIRLDVKVESKQKNRVLVQRRSADGRGRESTYCVTESDILFLCNLRKKAYETDERTSQHSVLMDEWGSFGTFAIWPFPAISGDE